MRIKSTILTLALVLLFPFCLFAFDGRVVSVSDGDTIKVLKHGIHVTIRLAAIDCPELGQSFGQAAKNFTAGLATGKVVKVWPVGTDQHGKTEAFVFVENMNLNKALIQAGLAWHYKQYSRDPELAKLEFKARAKKAGLWSEADPMPPWQWRKQ